MTLRRRGYLVEAKNKRVFVPTSNTVGSTNVRTSVERYEWTKGSGLFVIYKDGIRMKSDYSLKELIGPDLPEGPLAELVDGKLKPIVHPYKPRR